MSTATKREWITVFLPSGHNEQISIDDAIKLSRTLNRLAFKDDDLFQAILSSVATAWETKEAALLMDTKRPSVAHPRMAVMQILQRFGVQAEEVAKKCGRSRSMASYSNPMTADLMAGDRIFKMRYKRAVGILAKMGYSL